jgi:hypothetical protein
MIKIIPGILIGSFLVIATLANAQPNFAAVKIHARGKHSFVNVTDITFKPSPSVEYTTITTVIGATSTETITLCTPKVTSSTIVVTKTISGVTVTATEPFEVTYTPISTTTFYHGGSTVTITIPKTKVETATLTVPCTTDVTTVTTTTSSSTVTYVPITTTTTVETTLYTPSFLPVISTTVILPSIITASVSHTFSSDTISGAPFITVTHQPESETPTITAIITSSVPSIIPGSSRPPHVTSVIPSAVVIIPPINQVNDGKVVREDMAVLLGGLVLAGVILI